MFRTLALVLGGGLIAIALAYAAFTGIVGLGTKAHAAAPPASAYNYDGVVEIDPETTHLHARWQIHLDQPDTETLTYWLSENFEAIEVSGQGVESFALDPDSAPPGVVAISIQLTPASADPRQIEIGYEGILFPEPMPNRINSISPELVEFTVDSFWHPFDARFDQYVTGQIDLRIPGDWTPVTPGHAQVHAQGVSFEFGPGNRDFPITLLTEYEVRLTNQYRVFDTREGARDLSAFADMVGFCTAYLDTRFGEREPLLQANIVIHRRTSSGYARGTLIALTDIGDTFTDATQRFICHELAHYWASNGNPGTVENWINESFAEYIGIMAVRERRGAEAYAEQMGRLERRMAELGEQPSIWTADDLSRRPHSVNYIKGPIALAALEARIGEPAFAELTRRMMVDRIATTPELLAELEDIAGAEHRAWFEARLAE